MYNKLEKCRICENKNLIKVLDLGVQFLTGVFPKNKDQKITSGPVQLVKCSGKDSCGLLQLAHSYDIDEMYGDNYGYRSGLNKSMVKHLEEKISKIEKDYDIKDNDLIIDIGSNDCTSLKAYSNNKLNLVGIDPTAEKFRSFYPTHVNLISDFFSAKLVQDKFPNKKAKVITSFAMFYDLEQPLEFMKDINLILDEDGIWSFEQSYMPQMIETNSFDTACHEHLEFYALKQIKWMCDEVGLKIIDISFNDINGGSFSVTVAKKSSNYSEYLEIQSILDTEDTMGLNELEIYEKFDQNAKKVKKDILDFIKKAKNENKTIAGIGASTKGNVVLQYCNISENEIFAIGEVNEDKFGTFSPGSLIPIISEEDLFKHKPDYLFVLPWHFKEFFLSNDKYKDYSFVFPLPSLEIIERSN
jgi:NDP-4-keto-2,6-dideoxyhexose 3-C-methyltransferase